MEAESKKNERGKVYDRQLFGTLLASKPAPARSPLALTLSIAAHVAIVALLVVISRPFVPELAHKLFDQITIIKPVEEPQVTLDMTPVAPPPVAPRIQPKQDDAANRNPPALTFTPGPIVPIQPPTAGPEMAEPSDNGMSGNGKSLADRLRPAHIDPRLSPRGSYVSPDISPAEAVNIRIAQTLQQYNDSMAAEAEARNKGLDWTIKTKDGKQWGIGPDGKIHLGSITLPALAQFSPPPGRRDEINARNRAFAEIEAQASREIGRQTFKDRVKAIRERKDKEREEKKKAADSAPITN